MAAERGIVVNLKAEALLAAIDHLRPGSTIVEIGCVRYRYEIVIDDVQAIHERGQEPIERGKGDLLLDRLAADGFTVDLHVTEPGYRMAVAR